MSKAAFTVQCRERLGAAPRLSRAVMGNMADNLLRTGVRLQKVLEGLSDTPLLRRTMGTLNSGIGIDKSTGVCRVDAVGEIRYDFRIMDQVLDVMVGPGSIPFFGLCFMPDGLSSARAPTGEEEQGAADLPPEAGERKATRLTEPWMQVNRFPPADYQRWYDLVHAVVRHAVERYGQQCVSGWYWKFWNEPDLRFYWPATHEEYMKTYDYAAAAVKEALPEAKVGGPGPANPANAIFLEFLEHCTSGTNHCTGAKGAPLDFITFHMKGGPTGRMGDFSDPWTATDYQVRHPSLGHIIDATRRTMAQIATVPGTEGLPVFLTECDIDWGTGTSIYNNPNMHYRNSEYFAAFQCALNKRMLDVRAEFPRNPIEATFMDTFYIPGRRIFEGQRTLVTADVVDKPILNALRLLGRMGTQRLAVTEPEGAEVEVLATAEGDSVQVMAVNFREEFDYDGPIAVAIDLDGLPNATRRCRHWRIDREHSNAYTAWLEMGRPVVPDDAQLAAIQARQGLELLEPEFEVAVSEGKASLRTVLPPHSVSMWELADG